MARRKKAGLTSDDYPWLSQYTEDIRWDMDIPKASVHCLFDDAVKAYGNKTAIDFLGKHYSYKTLGVLVDRLAKGLQSIGVKRGDRVGLLLPNCPQYIISYFAIAKVGATVVNINPLYTLKELTYEIEDAKIDRIITLNLNALFSKVVKLLQSTPLKQIIVSDFQKALPFPKNLLFPIVKKDDIAPVMYSRNILAMDDLMRNDGKYLPVHIDPEEDLAMLQYTGGTTGVPKGAMLTHYNVYANTVQCKAMLSPIADGQETMLAVLPFFHIFAMTAVMNIGLVKGMKLLIHPRFDLINVLKDIKKKKPTIMVGVPTMLVAMINHPDIAKYKMQHINLTVTGGAALPIPVKEAFQELTGSPVLEGYGLTENAPVATLTPPFGENRAGSIGIPIPKVVIDIIDLEDKEKILPIGETGEICISGPQVMKGYWNPKEGMENPIINGRLHTGDVGYIDDDGYVHIVDRLKDMIISGGYNIYPRNLEDAALEHLSVKEAAVIGVIDDYKGQVPKMFITLRPGESLTEAELRTHLSKKLAKIYMPEHIIFREELPKTMIGKVDKKVLKEEEGE